MEEKSPLQKISEADSFSSQIRILFFDIADCLDLQQNVLGESGHLHAGTRGTGSREETAVDRIDLREIIHILDEDGRLDDIGHR